MVLVSVRGAWKIFGATVALRDVSLEMGEGESLLLLGPNGSGKSTLIKVVGGLLRLDRGTARVMGNDAWRLSLRRRRDIGMALDDFHIPWWTSAKAFLRHVARIKGVEWGEIEELARRLNVVGYWEKLALRYSSGMAKRIGLLQALVGRPKLLLLDEPLALLDAHSRRVVVEILGELRGEAGMIIASHIVFGLERLVDNVLVLVNGEVQASGRAEDVARLQGALGIRCRRDVERLVPRRLREDLEEMVMRGEEMLLYGVPRPLEEMLLASGLCRGFADLDRLYRRVLERGSSKRVP